MKNLTIKACISVALLATSGLAFSAEDTSNVPGRDQRMSEALQKYRDASANGSYNQRGTGRMARAEGATKRGFHRAGDAVKRGAHRTGDAIRHAGERVKGATDGDRTVAPAAKTY